MTRYLEYPINENGAGLRIGVVVARFNQDVCDGLLSGAIKDLHRLGVAGEDITVCSVPICVTAFVTPPVTPPSASRAASSNLPRDSCA